MIVFVKAEYFTRGGLENARRLYIKMMIDVRKVCKQDSDLALEMKLCCLGSSIKFIRSRSRQENHVSRFDGHGG